MLLNASGLSKSFGKKTVLSDVSFSVNEHEIVSLMGVSGEGKSTLARILCGTVKPDSGVVTYRGETLIGAGIPYNPEFRKGVQMIPQQPFAALDPRQKVGDAIAEPLLFHKIVSSRAEARKKVSELLEKVWLEPVHYDRRPRELSGGQAQRVLIARSLTVSPRLLIADEATSMLDVSSQAQIIQILKTLIAEDGLSIILISHDRQLVDSISDRNYMLTEGKLSIDHLNGGIPE